MRANLILFFLSYCTTISSSQTNIPSSRSGTLAAEAAAQSSFSSIEAEITSESHVGRSTLFDCDIEGKLTRVLNDSTSNMHKRGDLVTLYPQGDNLIIAPTSPRMRDSPKGWGMVWLSHTMTMTGYRTLTLLATRQCALPQFGVVASLRMSRTPRPSGCAGLATGAALWRLCP